MFLISVGMEQTAGYLGIDAVDPLSDIQIKQHGADSYNPIGSRNTGSIAHGTVHRSLTAVCSCIKVAGEQPARSDLAKIMTFDCRSRSWTDQRSCMVEAWL